MRNLFIKTTLMALAFSAAFSLSAKEQTNSGNHNGGLMKQMMNEQYQIKSINDPVAQQRLNQIDLGDTNHQSNH
ncbi:hypothetical protein [uncultured Tolumonas sp.]|uniref:hypothetical protein n=1 Tax=uncultured Tolumonas sp. TaxID=263765 RepID=UPI002A0A1F88|nr:hypothetical protein [uncultured Tolumonas sp.]